MLGSTETCLDTDTKLKRIAWLSANEPHKRFDSLMHHFNEASLAACFHESDGNKAVGIDGVSIDPVSNVNGFVLSLLPELGTMGSKWGGVRATGSSTSSLSFDIELLYLPPYSPNLNLVERLWKFVKKKCLWSKYYANFEDFKEAIMDCLIQTHTTSTFKVFQDIVK